MLKLIWEIAPPLLLYFLPLSLMQWSSSPQYNADDGHGSSKSTCSWDPSHFHQVLHYTNPSCQHAPCPESRHWSTGPVLPSDVTLSLNTSDEAKWGCMTLLLQGGKETLNMASQEDCVALEISVCTELFSVTFYSCLKSMNVKQKRKVYLCLCSF